ncbi:MAG: twin-arginine translocation signal domain-containing protein, partial [Pseudomonadota bacterium]
MTKTSRRQFMGALAAGVAAPAILRSTRAYAQSPTIRVGFVTPSTGPLAGFAEADDYILEGLRAHFAGGVTNNGKSYTIEIIKKDSQSNPNRAAEV